MIKSKEITKDERIKKEIKRLRTLLKDIPDNKLKVAEGLIKRASFMLVTLEDLELDLNTEGTVETFSQTKGIEYDRERPAAKLYNAFIKNYTSLCKQLLDLIPNETTKKEASDDLLEFVQKTKR